MLEGISYCQSYNKTLTFMSTV